MSTPVNCPKCRAELSLEGVSPGATVRCNACGATVRYAVKAKPKARVVEAAAPVAGERRAPADDGKTLKRREKKRKRQAAARVRRRRWVAGGVAGLVLLVGVVVGVLWSLGGNRGGPNDPDDPTAEGHAFEVVTASATPKDPAAKVPGGVVYPFAAVEAARGPVGAAAVAPAKWTRPVPAGLPADESVDGDGVPVPIGPAPDAPAFAADVVIPVASMTAAEGTTLGPILSPDCRFAVVPTKLGPIAPQEFRDDPKVPGRRFFAAQNPAKPQPPHAVYDLSTGGVVGEYPGGVPLSLDGRLAPDGQHLVTRAWEQMPRLAAGQSFWLDVWKQGAKAVTGQLAPTGCVRWAEFVSPTRLAVLQDEPDPALVVWDVVTRKVVRRIETTPARPKSATPDPDRPAYSPNPFAGAVAPGGRFVAVGGANDVTVFDLDEGKPHGRFPTRGAAGPDKFFACAFVTGPNRLVAFTAVAPGKHLAAWDLDTGKLTHASWWDDPTDPTSRNAPGGRVEAGGPDRLAFLPSPSAGTKYAGTPFPLARGGVGLHYYYAARTDERRIPPRIVARFKPEWRDFNILYSCPTADLAEYKLELKLDPLVPFREVVARPAVPTGSRAGVAAVKPEPPAAWTAPPSVESAPPGVGGLLPQWPAALTETQGAVVRFTRVSERVRRYGRVMHYYEMHWDRYDLATGRRVGAAVPLWPWVRNPDAVAPDNSNPHEPPPPPPPAALTADGGTLALVDPSEPHRVDLWKPNGERTGFYATPEGGVVEWLGFAADGKLLVLCAGTLTAWDAKTATAAWELDGGYRPPGDLARGATWAAFSAGTHVDLLDTATGKCLGRCRTAGGDGVLAELAVSPDGRRMIAMSRKAQVTRSADGAYEFYDGTLWDLTAGTAESFPFGTRRANLPNEVQHAGWVSPDHFAALLDTVNVFDVKARGLVAQFKVDENLNSGEPKPWMKIAPDGRIWMHAVAKVKTADLPGPRVWTPVPLPAEMALLTDPAREYVRIPVTPLRVEVDLRTPGPSKRAAQAMADQFAKAGYALGESGWKVRLTFRQADAFSTLTGGLGGDVRIHAAQLDWSLVGPGGGEPAWTFPVFESMLPGTKYAKASKTTIAANPSGQTYTTTQYDFGGRNATAALAEEYLEKLPDKLVVPVRGVPDWVIVSRGKALALPLAGSCPSAPAE